MSLARLFLKRIALGFVAAWTVITTVFLAFTASRDWVKEGIVGNLRYAGLDEEEIQRRTNEYLEARGFDRPLPEQYVDWVWSMLSLDWGNSFATGEPALTMVTEGLQRSAMYILPGLAIAIVVGIGLGLYTALRPDSWLANTSVGTAYLVFALPNFWVGGMLYSLDPDVVDVPPVLFEHVFPIALTAATLLGGYVSYARAHSREYSTAEFVKLVKTKGAGPALIAKHIVRNAAIPFVSMIFVEALALMVLTVFIIETVFGIDGFGMVLFQAIENRDLPVVLGSTLVIVAVGIAGNILQDVAYTALDPRVDTGSR